LASVLPVRDPRLADAHLHAGEPVQLFHRDFEVKLAHPREDEILRLFVRVELQRRVVARETVDRLASLPESVEAAGMIACEITGLGKVMLSRATGASSSQRVWPV